MEADSNLPSFPFPSDWVIQDRTDVRKFVALPPGRLFLRGEGVEPLVVIMLTRWEAMSTVGIAWHHAIGK